TFRCRDLVDELERVKFEQLTSLHGDKPGKKSSRDIAVVGSELDTMSVELLSRHPSGRAPLVSAISLSGANEEPIVGVFRLLLARTNSQEIRGRAAAAGAGASAGPRASAERLDAELGARCDGDRFVAALRAAGPESTADVARAIRGVEALRRTAELAAPR